MFMWKSRQKVGETERESEKNEYGRNMVSESSASKDGKINREQAVRREQKTKRLVHTN